MTKKFYTIGCTWAIALVVAASSGCIGVHGPGLGVLSIPAPVSPFHQQKAEDHALEKQRYGKVAILPQISDENHIALDPPSDDEVIRALEEIRPVSGGIPGLEVTMRNVKGITKELIADYVDPPRVVPLVGPVQLHHAHYKCTVYFEEITQVGWPVPHQVKTESGVEVIYIDKDHFHRVGGGEVHAPLH
ncbi:MAG: hypothetical protein FWG73_07625 [Planctomycetaceae bacterium]|nr:hypothetical protein [Planctomycetaceae bacterium]